MATIGAAASGKKQDRAQTDNCHGAHS
jgi:hypothetical protein